MRRSLAPSQILKQSQSPSTTPPAGKRRSSHAKKRKRFAESDDDDGDDDDDRSSPASSSSPAIRSPLSPLVLNSASSSSSPQTGSGVVVVNAAEYERLIQQILSRPFKIPIKNYAGPVGTKSLGYRKNGARRPLHDPDEEGALILWAPPELSATDALIVKEDKMQVIFFDRSRGLILGTEGRRRRLD